MLLHRLADLVVEGKDAAEVCAELMISAKMYEWLTGNDGFQLALAASRQRRDAATADAAGGNHARD